MREEARLRGGAVLASAVPPMTSPVPGITVRFFSTTRKLFGAGDVAVPLDAAVDVEGLLLHVCDTAERSKGVFAVLGALRSDITVLVNGRNIALLDGLKTRVQSGDVVAVIPPMAGG